MTKRLLLPVTVIIAITLFSCNSETKTTGGGPAVDSTTPVRGDWVRAWISSEPDNLNMHCHKTAGAGYVLEHIHMPIMWIDPENFEMKPCLVTDMPIISPDNKIFSFEIRPEATWDDGSPITGHDVAFTFKAFRNPLVEDKGSRISFEFVEDVIVDSVNPKKFSITTKFPYFKSFESIGALQVGPQYLLDPNGYMKKFSVRQLDTESGSKEETALTNDPDIQAFAKAYNSAEFGRDPKYVAGAGPYSFESWVTGQSITLVRKKNWWGDKLTQTGPAFQAWPDKIIYKIISDRSTAFAGLKSEEIDVLSECLPKDFYEAMQGGIVKEKYNLFTPDMYSVSFIGMNNRPSGSRAKLFNDVRVRRAMAHLIDVDEIIKNVYYGYGTRAVGPISPRKSNLELNDTLQPIPFSIDKAKVLLAEAGWKDTDGDGWLDKMIDGKKVTFETEIMFGEGSQTGMTTSLHFQKNCEKAGIKLNIHPLAFPTLSEKLEQHDFDLYALTMSGSHLLTDLKQVYHTESYTSRGVNSFGFSNPEADKLMEDIRLEPDALKRKPMYWRIQEIIYQQQPIIFLWYPKDRIAIHKRFVKGKASMLRPNYQASSLWAPLPLQKFK